MQIVDSTELFYSGLSQGKYYNCDEKQYIGCLMYGDKLVDSRTAKTYDIKQIIEKAAGCGVSKEKAIIELAWNDLNEAIILHNNFYQGVIN